MEQKEKADKCSLCKRALTEKDTKHQELNWVSTCNICFSQLIRYGSH